jgi:murein DD-endopeptidase MepM/ murein hydrolase activator NlpD
MTSNRKGDFPWVKFFGAILLMSLSGACTTQLEPVVVTPTTTSTIHPTFTATIPTVTFTLEPSVTATFPPAETLTLGPTSIPRDFVYVFPLQPASAAGFIEGTKAHGYPATDIFAIAGTKFVAVTDGRVDFVSDEDTWDPATDEPASRGGLSVAVIGKDGLRYYGSHLSAIASGIRTGMQVTAGQLLGWVGNSGDARNTISHVHFGISKPTTPDDWKTRRGQVDPFPYLEAWRDGHNVTPPMP